MKISVFLFFVFISMLYGCTLSPKVEIADHSLRYVKRTDIKHVIGNDSNSKIVRWWSAEDFLVIRIHSKENLYALAEKTGSTLYPNIYLCSNPGINVILGIPKLYINGESIPSLRLHGKSTAHTINEKGRYEYDIVLFLAWDKKRALPDSVKNKSAQSHYLNYNLIINPDDVCINIEGGNLVQTIKSNQVKIERAAIQNVTNTALHGAVLTWKNHKK